MFVYTATLDIDIKNKYSLINLSDMCKEIFKIQSVNLSEEYDEKMPLLLNIMPSKKKVLKR